MAYVSNARKLYTFGLGGNGQLGVGSSNKQLTPTLVRAPFVCVGLNPKSFEDAPLVVRQIFSAGDQCFVIVSTARVQYFYHLFSLQWKSCNFLNINGQAVTDHLYNKLFGKVTFCKIGLKQRKTNTQEW